MLNICEGELVIGKGRGIGILVTGNILFLTFSLSKQAMQMKVCKTNTMQTPFHNSCIGLNKWKASQDSIELTYGKQKYSNMGERAGTYQGPKRLLGTISLAHFLPTKDASCLQIINL